MSSIQIFFFLNLEREWLYEYIKKTTIRYGTKAYCVTWAVPLLNNRASLSLTFTIKKKKKKKGRSLSYSFLSPSDWNE